MGIKQDDVDKATCMPQKHLVCGHEKVGLRAAAGINYNIRLLKIRPSSRTQQQKVVTFNEIPEMESQAPHLTVKGGRPCLELRRIAKEAGAIRKGLSCSADYLRSQALKLNLAYYVLVPRSSHLTSLL